MWHNILKGLKTDEKEKLPQVPTMPLAPVQPALPTQNPGRMTWAQAKALKKLRGW